MADGVLAHQQCRILCGVLVCQAAHRSLHHLPDGKFQAEAGAQNQPQQVVAGEDPLQAPAFIHDEHGPDVAGLQGFQCLPQRRGGQAVGGRLTHQLGQRRLHGLLRKHPAGVVLAQGLAGFLEQGQHAPVEEIREHGAALGQCLDVCCREGQHEHIIRRGVGGEHGSAGQRRRHRQHLPGFMGEDARLPRRPLFAAHRSLANEKDGLHRPLLGREQHLAWLKVALLSPGEEPIHVGIGHVGERRPLLQQAPVVPQQGCRGDAQCRGGFVAHGVSVNP